VQQKGASLRSAGIANDSQDSQKLLALAAPDGPQSQELVEALQVEMGRWSPLCVEGISLPAPHDHHLIFTPGADCERESLCGSLPEGHRQRGIGW
jgi:hypothetical protein